MDLDQLPRNRSARLRAIGGEGGFRRRLLELGFLPGTTVRMVRRVEIGGVIEVELRGCHVSLSAHEARIVQVDPVQVEPVQVEKP